MVGTIKDIVGKCLIIAKIKNWNLAKSLPALQQPSEMFFKEENWKNIQFCEVLLEKCKAMFQLK